MNPLCLDSLHQALDVLPYDNLSIISAVDEIIIRMWTIEWPIKYICDWLRTRRGHTFPHRFRRWMRFLQSDMAYVILHVPAYYIDNVRLQYSHTCLTHELRALYSHILSNARPAVQGYTVQIHININAIFVELVARGILRSRAIMLPPNHAKFDVDWHTIRERFA